MDTDVVAEKTQSVAVEGGDPSIAALPVAPPSGDASGAEVIVPSAKRTLRALVSRERSPRRPSALASASSLTLPRAPLPAASAGAGGFTEGQAAVLDGLVSRPELSGRHVILRAFDAATSRWAASLDASDEVIRVKTINLMPLVFGPCGADG